MVLYSERNQNNILAALHEVVQCWESMKVLCLNPVSSLYCHCCVLIIVATVLAH